MVSISGGGNISMLSQSSSSVCSRNLDARCGIPGGRCRGMLGIGISASPILAEYARPSSGACPRPGKPSVDPNTVGPMNGVPGSTAGKGRGVSGPDPWLGCLVACCSSSRDDDMSMVLVLVLGCVCVWVRGEETIAFAR